MRAPRARSIVLGLLLSGCATRPLEQYAIQFRGDLQKAAHSFVEGSMSGRDYLEVSKDRHRKWRALAANVRATHRQPGGDRDRDGVPDPIDRCETPPMQPTTDDGCPLPPRPACDEAAARCGPTTADDQRARDILSQIYFMFDANCDGSPTPQTPAPLEWGRGQQPALNDAGFNMSVTQVNNQLPTCRLYYEIELEAVDITVTGRVNHGRSLFRSSEDLRPLDARRAVFGVGAYISDLPGRQRMIDMFNQAEALRWRVRAVNGMGAKSSWSQWRTQGPASGGVHGGDL